MKTFRQIKAEKAICSDGVSAALQGVPRQGSACTQECLDFSSFEFWVGEGEGVFKFSFVANMFPMGSHQVLNIFRTFPMCSSRVFPIVPL
jgi:hypothetical protein